MRSAMRGTALFVLVAITVFSFAGRDRLRQRDIVLTAAVQTDIPALLRTSAEPGTVDETLRLMRNARRLPVAPRANLSVLRNEHPVSSKTLKQSKSSSTQHALLQSVGVRLSSELFHSPSYLSNAQPRFQVPGIRTHAARSDLPDSFWTVA